MGKRDGVIGNGSHAAIKAHSLGLKHTTGPVFSEDLPAAPAELRHRKSHVAPTAKHMEHHPKAGPIYSNSPIPRTRAVGQRDHPVEDSET